MKKLIKIRHGDPIPKNGKHVSTVVEPDHENAISMWVKSNDPLNVIGWLVGTHEVYVTKTPNAAFYYYEIEVPSGQEN